MVRVGDWSYSLYLWHWPVIVLVRSNIGPERFDSIAVRLLVLVAVFVLSWATYRWVETPFRTGHPWQRLRPALAIYPASVLAVVLTVVASTQVMSWRLGGWTDEPAISSSDYDREVVGRDRWTSLVKASVLAAREGRPVPSDLVPGLLDLREQTAPLGECDYRTGTTRLCPIGDPRRRGRSSCSATATPARSPRRSRRSAARTATGSTSWSTAAAWPRA
jgi:hypothetical protein